jgi:hypothetical protein
MTFIVFLLLVVLAALLIGFHEAVEILVWIQHRIHRIRK